MGSGSSTPLTKPVPLPASQLNASTDHPCAWLKTGDLLEVYSASANEFIWASVHSRDGEGLMMTYGDRMRWLRLADEGMHRVVRRFVGVGQHVQVKSFTLQVWMDARVIKILDVRTAQVLVEYSKEQRRKILRLGDPMIGSHFRTTWNRVGVDSSSVDDANTNVASKMTTAGAPRSSVPISSEAKSETETASDVALTEPHRQESPTKYKFAELVGKLGVRPRWRDRDSDSETKALEAATLLTDATTALHMLSKNQNALQSAENAFILQKHELPGTTRVVMEHRFDAARARLTTQEVLWRAHKEEAKDQAASNPMPLFLRSTTQRKMLLVLEAHRMHKNTNTNTNTP